MGNEMGNNNTSGLREEDDTAQDKPQQEVARADDLKGQNHVVPATLDKDNQEKETALVSSDVEREYPVSDDQKTDNNEEDDTKTEGTKSLQDIAETDNDKGQNHEVVASEDMHVNEKDTGLASINPEEVVELHNDNQKQDEKEEECNMIPEDKEKSLQEAACADEAKGKYHLGPAADDKNTHENETYLVSNEPGGITSPSVDNQNQDEKEKDNSKKAEEIPLQEAASTIETKSEAHLVPAAEDKNTYGIETTLVSSDHDGMTYPCVDNQKEIEKAEDININDEAKEKSSVEAASIEVAERKDHLLPEIDDKSTHGNETWLISGDPEGTDPCGENTEQHEKEEDDTNAEPLLKDDHADNVEEKYRTIPAADNLKQIEQEEDMDINDEAKEKSSQEAASTDVVEIQDHLLPAAGDKNTNGIEKGLVSSDPERTDPHGDNTKQHEKEKDDMNVEPLPKDDHADNVEEKYRTIPAADNVKQIEQEEDIDINDETKEISSQEAASIDVAETQDHLLLAARDENTSGTEKGLVSSDPERTDPCGGNTTQHEKEEEQTSAEPMSKDDHADNVEEKNLIIPADEGEDCNNTEAKAELGSAEPLVVGDTLDNQTIEVPEQERTELHSSAESTRVEEKTGEAFDEGRETQPASSSKNLEDNEMKKESSFNENRSEAIHHFENQNSRMEENEGTRSSISDAVSSTSHDSVPEEPAVIEPEEHELANIHTEQLIQVCNGPLKSEDVIIPSCQDQENRFILDSSISSDTVQFPDPSLDVEKERDGDDFLVKEMATKEVNSEGKFEPKDGEELGNHLGNITTLMTDLPNGNAEKCNAAFPSDINSMENDFPELQVEASLSDETHNLSLQASKTEEKRMVLTEKATTVTEESENANAKYFHFQIQSEEESVEKSNGHGSEEGSSSDEQNASPPPFVMNGHQNEEKPYRLDTSCDSNSSNKDYQSEEEIIIENSQVFDVSINYQNEATGGQQEETQKEVHLVTDPAVISAETSLMDHQNDTEEDSKEKKMIEEMVEKMEDSNPFGNDKSRSENGGECVSLSYPKQEEAFLIPSLSLHALTEKQQQDSHMECKKVQDSNESMAELKQESSGQFSTNEASSFVTQNMAQKNVASVVELSGQKPLWDLSERPKPSSVTISETKAPLKQSSEQCAIGETPAIANGDYYQRESVGRFSTESNPDNMSIHAQMWKSPSFDLDLRIDARAEESDQTPLLYQDKTTIESFTSQQADVSDNGKPVADTEYAKNSLQYEAMPVEEKVVTLERSDSDKSKTPFLGFLKEEEEADQMLITPKKQDNQSEAKKAIPKVSIREITSASTKGKEKRKPRTSLFGTCMCCATVIN